MSPLAVVLPAVLLLAAIVAVIGGQGGLHRNRYFGIRVPAAMRSDRAWVAAHRASVLPATVGFVVTTAAGIATWFGAIPELKYAVVAVFIVDVVVMMILANRAAKSAEQSPQAHG